jgi:hypothetical protein
MKVESDFKGVKGTWTVGGNQVWSSERRDDKDVCITTSLNEDVDGNPQMTKEEVIANSALIAAAPEMLEALILVSDHLELNFTENNWHIMGKVKLAITKAIF